MSQKNGFDLNDPIGNIRKARDVTLDAMAKTMVDVVNTEAFARWLGSYLDAYLAASAPMQRMIETSMKTTLARFNMPSREEVTTLARRMTNIEMRLDDLDVKVDGLSHMLRNQAPVIVELLAEQAHQNGDGADVIEQRLSQLDSKTDQLLHLIERLQATPAEEPPARRRKSRQPETLPEPEPPTPQERKEDRAIEDF